MKKFKNNRTPADCGVTALENVEHLSGKKRSKKSMRKAGATKEGGVLHWRKYGKAVKKLKPVVSFKRKAKPSPKDIKKHLEQDKPQGSTRNASIIHTKTKKGKDSHLSLVFGAKGNKLKIANWKDGEEYSEVPISKLEKEYKIERAYDIKIKKKEK